MALRRAAACAPLAVTAGCCLALAACGSPAPQQPSPAGSLVPVPGSPPVVGQAASGGSVEIAGDAWSLDQLAPAPGDNGPNPVLLGVLRVSTTAPRHVLYSRGMAIIDDLGARWPVVANPVYVPIDGLDGIPVAPQHSAAGVVAFRIPDHRRAVGVGIPAAAGEVTLAAPR